MAPSSQIPYHCAMHLVSVHIGKVRPLGPDAVPSGFVKNAISSAARVTLTGIDGDEQADLSVHGGPEKAVYGYAFASYAAWRLEYPQHAKVLVPGGFGENLCIDGLKEADMCVGDVHRIGTAQLQVCQPRQPCFKLALRFEDKFMPKAMIRTGRAGWYYRVLESGDLRAGDAVHLEARPNPDFSFARLVELISHGKASIDELRRMSALPGLASSWQERARETLSHSA
jgi:MOSC domain-containing protein YiiM